MLDDFCFEPSPAYKGVSLLKRRRHFFLLNVFLWTCKYLYCHLNSCLKNIDLLCWVYKRLILFSLFTPRFFIRKKRHKHRGNFLEKGGNSLKRKYVEVGVRGRRKTNRNEQREEGSQKLEVSSERTFWMTAMVIFVFPFKLSSTTIFNN